MERIHYEIENRDALFAQLAAERKIITNDVTIDLVDGRLTTCYCEVADAPPAQEDLLAAADQRILDLEYENLLLQNEMEGAV